MLAVVRNNIQVYFYNLYKCIYSEGDICVYGPVLHWQDSKTMGDAPFYRTPLSSATDENESSYICLSRAYMAVIRLVGRRTHNTRNDYTHNQYIRMNCEYTITVSPNDQPFTNHNSLTVPLKLSPIFRIRFKLYILTLFQNKNDH